LKKSLQQKSPQHRSAAFKGWADTRDWSARTRPGRAAFEARFLEQADGDPKRAEAAKRAYFIDLARKSAEARKRRGGDS
jgi:hypothetical protein